MRIDLYHYYEKHQKNPGFVSTQVNKTYDSVSCIMITAFRTSVGLKYDILSSDLPANEHEYTQPLNSKTWNR